LDGKTKNNYTILMGNLLESGHLQQGDGDRNILSKQILGK